ncbi:DNA methyltransferase [Mammaliicoccus sciuri]|uniref:DNA methyltransferase n=1 Tax=Mammaliicoccus sciuri TaxID=1296 RepID=UPI003F54A14B
MSNIYSYHARFHESIPHEYIHKYSEQSDVILDPFCGSGTTLKEALKLKRNAYGIDISPIAILSSKVNTNFYDKKRLETEYENILNSFYLDVPVYFTRFPDFDRWYTNENYTQLCKLKNIIDNIEEDTYKEFFQLCFLSIANKVSNRRKTWNIGYLADNVLPNMESKYIAIDSFRQKVKKEIESINYEEIKEFNKFNIKIEKKDISAANIDTNVDMVMTSPPYPFAVDFIRYHRLSMYWLQENIEELTRKEIGARNKRNRKDNLALFFKEIEKSFLNVMDSVKTDGYWVMTIADTTRNKIKIPFIDWTLNLFYENGWVLIEDRIRELQQQSMAQKRIPAEHILVFKKI